MYVLHAHWQPGTAVNQLGALCLWAEKSGPHGAGEKLDKRRHTSQPHPFAAARPQLRDLLLRLSGGEIDAPDTARRDALLVLRLPSGRTGPQPSPQLIQAGSFDAAAPALAPWEMPMLALPAAIALQFLVALPTAALPQDIRLGDDVSFWRTAALLALETLAQHKLQPGLQRDAGGNLSARWLPVLDGPRDGPRLARLVTAMPPLCRAANGGDPPAARELLDSFLTFLVDGAMRDWCHEPAGGLTVANPVRDSAAHAWLGALLGRDARMQISGAQAQRLATSYGAWLRNLHAAGDKNFRVTLRLDAPPPWHDSGAGGETTPPWTLHYLLQARDDPSLLIDAQELWQPNGRLLRGLKARLANPQELLLGGLGFVARHCEPVRRSLHEKRPALALLSSEEAFAYLRHTAPLLETAGFGVLVPPWWNQPGARLGLHVRMQGAGSGGASGGVARGLLTMENLVRYQWELAVGGEPLSRDEFESLVALKSPLVQVRGKWVQLDAEQVEAAIRFWQKQDRQQGGGAEFGLLDAAMLALDGAAINGLPVEDVETEGWLGEWIDQFTGNEKLAVLPPPAGLSAELRPYQAYGYSWLEFQRRWGIGVCLADDMGLGKTIQTLAMLQRVKEQHGALPAPVLLVAPTSVVVNWAKEAARFTPDLRTLVHQGAQRMRGEEFGTAAREHDIVATSYALVRRDAAMLQELDWFGVILDEAQNIKNPATRQTQAIRRLPATFRLALTGTPVENRLAELWSIMHFLNPGFLGSQHTFRSYFALPIERYGDEQAAARLRRLVSPFILRRVKTDPNVIQDLPDKQETKEYCTLSTEQATLYEAVVRESLQAIAGTRDDGFAGATAGATAGANDIERKGLVLAMLMKLKQICNHPAQFLHQIDPGSEYGSAGEDPLARSGKLERLVELVDELLDAGDRALIFSQFAEMGGFLRTFLQDRFGVPVLFLHGGTPPRKRNEMVEQFQQETGGPRLFVLSLKAGGTGLNLTRANHVFHFDRWWNPAVEDQATDRAFRIGQKQNVQVHKFVCVGTLEEKIDAMIEQKKGLARAVVGGGENWLTELSTDELRDLVHLRREALP
jgi:superfamily II DNA or RNA helicase